MRTRACSALLLAATLTGSAAAAAEPKSPLAAPAIAARPLAKKDLPGWAKFTGTLDRALGWTDKNGQNVLVFSSRQSTRKRDQDVLKSYALTVEHHLESGGQVRILRTVRDLLEKCEYDLVAGVVAESVGVTDLDGDGLGEVTFAYKLGCRSDVSSDTLKLIVLQGATKYILRGETVIEIPDEGLQGGAYKAEPPEPKWPKLLLEHAKKVWKDVVML